MSSTLPDEAYVQQLLAGLFGEDVMVSVRDEQVAVSPTSVTATYISDEGVAGRALVCDLAFANRAGAALTMVPAGSVEEAIGANEMPDNMYENFYEVLNICVNLFPCPKGTRFALDAVSAPGHNDEGRSEFDNVSSTTTFDIDIPRYGKGAISLMELAAG